MVKCPYFALKNAEKQVIIDLEVLAMNYTVTSNNTKKTLAHALKMLLEKKPLSKITVSDIIRECGLNRKTFYYHFQDIHDLLKWMLNQEAIERVKSFTAAMKYEEGMYFLLKYIEENKHILNCVCDSLGSIEIKRGLYQDFDFIAERMLSTVEQSRGIRLIPEYRDFLKSFFIEAMSGKLLDIIQSKEECDRDQIIEDVFFTISISLEGIADSAVSAGKAEKINYDLYAHNHLANS